MTDKHYLTGHLAQRGISTPQSQPIPGRETEMSPNNAGGYGFAVGHWLQLKRFLILGSQGGTYYVGEHDLTKTNFDAINACLEENPTWVINKAWEVYDRNLAPKPDAAIFVLAYAAAWLGRPGDAPERDVARSAALAAVPNLRIATHLFMWKEFYESFRGWGSRSRKAIAQWYNSREPEALAYQMAKYQSRNGQAHYDLLNVSHPTPVTPAHNNLFKWATGAKFTDDEYMLLPGIVRAMGTLNKSTQDKSVMDSQVVALIQEHNLTREMLPTMWLNSQMVWRALLPTMPLHALVRNLGVMTAKGVIGQPFGDIQSIISKITGSDYIRKSHMHPVQLFVAGRQYAQGHGEKGKLSWSPDPRIIAALDHATTLAFSNVKPSGKNILVAIDGSGSMQTAINGYDYISCREAAVMMALATVKTEPMTYVVGFSEAAWPVPIGAHDTVRSAYEAFCQRIQPTSTDCAAPVALAIKHNWPVDAFVFYTDNESWAGSEHVIQSVDRYNKATGRQARAVSVAMASNNTSVLDPKNPNQLNVVGFDASTPQVISAFVNGEL